MSNSRRATAAASRAATKGYSRNPNDPELTIRHEELTEEIEHWQQIIKDAEAEGFKVWSKADFTRGDVVLYRGTWYEVLRVNPKSVTIPHIHNGTGKRIVRATDNRHDGWTWTAPYDDVSGRKSTAEMQQPPQGEAARTPGAGRAVPADRGAGTGGRDVPMCHSSQWHAEVRRCAHCHHAPEGEPTPASAPRHRGELAGAHGAGAHRLEKLRRSRKRALWAMTRREAQAVCGDPRTSGRSYMLTWTERPGTEGADWEWVPDNGSLAPVLEDLGITPRRQWAPAPQAPAA